ncbi:MAG: sigma 54-interacting transcriptional regulator [Deltaproteobacteria bacterium]|nr:sigma 54-interacting transcriptional regulator [Deltaproteobacteria bacterium]
MNIDEKEFFKEATLRICGSLAIEKALGDFFFYVRDYIPIDSVLLTYYLTEYGVSRTFALATVEGGKRVNLETHWPPEIHALAEKGQFPVKFYSNRSDQHPILKYAFKNGDKPPLSNIIVRLNIDGFWIGGLILSAEKQDQFNEEHFRLACLLEPPFAIALCNSRRYQELHEIKEIFADDKEFLEEELQRISGDEIIGSDFGLQGVMKMVRQVASLDSPVLLLGETGTGKEVIASAIHNASPRRSGPLIRVNCGAIPDTLMDSELFGHEKGAFTGAIKQKRGRFERANKGTIFLDEIGELSLEAQVRLLRVLQDREIERVGGTESIKVDIRIIAATHRNLERMIEEGRFREDLYFRLQVFPIVIPPLRDRIDDVPLLAQHFIRKKSNEMKLAKVPVLDPLAINRLMTYHWPGNVRELENAVERAIILSHGEPLTFSHLRLSKSSSALPTNHLHDSSLNLHQVMTAHIQNVLEMTKNRIEGERGAANLLGVNPSTLRAKMKKLCIKYERKNQL